jgi:hypothetical protein
MNSLFKSSVPGASPGASTTTITYPCQGQIELRNGVTTDLTQSLGQPVAKIDMNCLSPSSGESETNRFLGELEHSAADRRLVAAKCG